MAVVADVFRNFNKQENMAKIKEIKKVKYGNHYIECVVYENNETPEPIVCDPLPLPPHYKIKKFWGNMVDCVTSFGFWLAYPILKRYFK